MRSPNEEQTLAAFHHAAEELRFFKGQQWRVANYTLLAYAALVATPSLVQSCAVSAFAGVLVPVVTLAALAVLWSLEEALAKERGRLFTAREKHLLLIKEIHDGDRRVYRSAFSQRLAGFFHPSVTPEAPGRSVWRARIAKCVEALDPFIWLIAAVILGAILAIILIMSGPPPRVGG